MKKVLLFAAVVLFGFNVSAQGGFRIGLNVGAPTGSDADFASIVANIELEYDWEVAETIYVGASAGATVYSGKDEFNDFKYAPILASIDVALSDDFSIGGDVGYGVSLETDFDGALVYRFQARYHISEHFDLTGRFGAFSSNIGTLSNASFGIGYRF